MVLFGFSFAFFYHLMNGVRHLAWDTGHGLERAVRAQERMGRVSGRRRSTVFFWVLVLRSTGGAA